MIENRRESNWPRVLAWCATVAALVLLYGIVVARLLP